MYFKLHACLVIVTMITIFLVISASSEVTPILNPQLNELRSKCSVLPEVGKPKIRYLIETNCYVDKTEYLFKMIQMGEPFYFLARPRRFGKTLLIDVLEALFTGMQELFKNTAIYQDFINRDSNFKIKTTHWPEYPVISLDFSLGISTESIAIFKEDMLTKLRNIAILHDIHLTASSAPSALRQLIWSVQKKYEKEVVVLIDEYDSPYTRAVVKNTKVASGILATLQQVFTTLRGLHESIRFSLTTGVTYLNLSRFFTVATDLTMDPNFSGIVGFNETEVHQYFGRFIKDVAKAKGISPTEILSEMKKWHDGFQFTKKNESLYCPISVIGYLSSKGKEYKAFTAALDDSKFFVEKFKQLPKQALEIFLNDGIDNPSGVSNKRKITAKEIELTGKINFENSLSTVALTVLLFHTGYLRIKNFYPETDNYILEFANQEVKENYAMMLYYSFFNTSQNPTDLENQVNSLLLELDSCRWKSFIKKLNSLHSRIPCFLLNSAKRVPEALFKVSMYWIFHFAKYAGLREPTMEDGTNFGQSDILLPLESKMHIFELKTLQNAENPLYECKVKYPQKHFFGTKEVVCVGLKFSPQGVVEHESWGVAKFSKEGKLIEEIGSITLTTQLNSKEKQIMKNILADFKNKHSNFILQPDKLIEFLTDIGPTTDDEQSFTKHFTTDVKTLCALLREIKKELQPNLKSIIQGFLNRNDPEEKEKKGK